MPKLPVRSRIFSFPHNDLLFDARLDVIREEPTALSNRGKIGNVSTATNSTSGKNGKNGNGDIDIVLDISAFEPLGSPEQCIIEGRPHEVVEGDYRPLSLRFSGAEWISRTGAYANLDALPDDEHTRRLFGVVHARGPSVGEYYLLETSAKDGICLLRAYGYRLEERSGARSHTRVVRRWAPTPPRPAGLLPHRPVFYRRYAGDPITIHLNGRAYRHRLIIGGMHHQHAERPAVDHVLNLCGVANEWVNASGHHPNDRFLCKGEMSAGMDASELLEEARWVMKLLLAGRRVLVHCYAGINRSATVCCAALMLLEGVTAEQALARIREQHPEAWPDPYHWFVLLWLSDHGENTTTSPAHATPIALRP